MIPTCSGSLRGWTADLVLTSQVLELLEEQLHRVDQRIDALLLVGGFSGSEYLFKRVDVRFLFLMLFSSYPNPPSTLRAKKADSFYFAYPTFAFFHRINLAIESRSLLDHPMQIPQRVEELHSMVSLAGRWCQALSRRGRTS